MDRCSATGMMVRICTMSDARISVWTALVRGPPEGLCLDFVNTCSWRGTVSPPRNFRRRGTCCSGSSGPGHWTTRPCSGRADGRPSSAPDGPSLATVSACGSLVSHLRRDHGDLAPEADSTPSTPPSAPRPNAGACGTGRADASGNFRPGHLLRGSCGTCSVVGWRPLAGSRLRLTAMCQLAMRWLFVDDSKSGTRRWCSMASAATTPRRTDITRNDGSYQKTMRRTDVRVYPETTHRNRA